MDFPYLDTPLGQYQWALSLITAVAVMGLGVVIKHLAVMLVPTFREASAINQQSYETKMQKPAYAANQKLNRKWGLFFYFLIFAVVMPFCLTSEAQPWWRVLRDIFVILMVYDFFYYLVHRFLFHDNGFLGGPLKWVHAVHHRQHNPCRMDSSYIHPIEVAGGLGLYVGTILGLSFVLGEFHAVTIIITWIAFSEINLHNHDLWQSNRFPFRYLNTMSVMHHNHHAKFTGGNFATISLLYDWMFGTLDYGDGGKARAKKA